MKNRQFINDVLKAKNPNELKVCYAESMEDQIRFYINKTEYFSAIEFDGGCKVEFNSNCENYKSTGNSKKIRITFIYISINLIFLMSLFYIWNIINNILIWIPVIDLLFTIINTLAITILNLDMNNLRIRSKHSAEHMMINFLEQNKRLPKTIKEVRKYSRFSKNCGCRLLFDGAVENLLCIVPATVCMYLFVKIVFKYSIAYWVYLILYFIFKIIFTLLVVKCKSFKTIVSEIKSRLSYIVQYFTTTDKVEDRDIIIAYYAAKPWIKVVYPEFYNFENDTFWISEALDFLKVN